MIYYPDRLFELLPVEYRERDAEQGYPLRALLRIVSRHAGLIEEDIQRLWDNLFIETCQPWVIPYIGDLVGNRLLADGARLTTDATARSIFTDLTGPDLRPQVALRSRADVAKTIYYRRRKGTLPMLEELARDVTGWPAHAVEFFELLGWHQHLEHLRLQSRWTDVRSVDRMDRVGGPFDETSHTVDVRAIAQNEGWHGTRKVGFFLFRLSSFELERSPARRAGEDWQYHFSPLGNPAPLFTRWRREGDDAGLATELHVAAPLRPPFFYEDLVAYAAMQPPRPQNTRLYGLPDVIPTDTTTICPECSLVVIRNGEVITPAQDPDAPPAIFQPQVVCRQLDPWPTTQPAGRILGIDVERGRMVIGDGFPGTTDTVDVYFHYGFPAELGGGPYERHRWLIAPGIMERELFVQEDAAPTSTTFNSLVDAITAWRTTFGRADTVITILDNRSYALPGSIQIPNDGALVIQAANGTRAHLTTPAPGLEIGSLPPAVPGDPDRQASFTFSGVLVEGHVFVRSDMGRFRLLHSTLVPGRTLDDDGNPASLAPSVSVDAGTDADPLNAQLRIEIAFSITGRWLVPGRTAGLWLLDSIVDALDDDTLAVDAPATSLVVERSTLLGGLDVRTLEMSESIATGLMHCDRTQAGCVRFSFVRPGSTTPRRYRCQPELAVAAAIETAVRNDPTMTAAQKAALRAAVESRTVPAFNTRRYGQPAYVQLRDSVPVGIRTGSEDGSEMGVYAHVKQAQREANLRLRLDEYLPFGLEAGILFAT
jgi:hypothetical protein